MESKEILSYLGMPEAEITSLDQFKDYFGKSFIKKDIEVVRGDKEFHGKLLGSYAGGITTAMKRSLKKAGLEVTDELWKGKSMDEAVESAIEEVATKRDEKIKSLEESAGKGSDEKIKEWEEKYGKVVSDLEQHKSLLSATKTQVEQEKAEWQKEKNSWAEEKKNGTKNSLLTKKWDGFKYKNGASDLEKEGFQSYINKKYKVELNETMDDVIPLDSSGNKIPNPSKIATFKTLDEILVEEGIAKNIYAVNPHDGKPSPTGKPTPTPTPDKTDSPRRKVNTLIPS